MSNLGSFVRGAAGCALAAFAMMALGAAAEETQPGGAQAAKPNPGERQGLETLVITAERRTSDLQTTGVAATVLTGEDLVDKSVFGLTALQYAAPSVTISDLGSANVFNIRGIGRSQVDVDLPSGVVIYRDGAPTLAGYFQNEPYFDMASIEVLRGPQGTFVGKSAAGGAVFIRTNNPQLGVENGSLEVGAGEFNQAEVTAVLNAPVADTVAVRLAYNYSQRNDFYDSITGPYTGDPGQRELSTYRLGVLWQPIEQLDVLLKVDYSDLDFGGNPTSSYQTPLFKVVQEANFAYKDRSSREVLDVKYHFDNGMTLTSLSGAQDVSTVNNLDANGTAPGLAVFDSRGDIDIYSQEINLLSATDQRLRWILGAFYQKQEIDIPTWEHGGFTFTGFGSGPDFPFLTSPWKQNSEDWAAFAHVAYDVMPNLELELGVRYSNYEMDQKTNWTLGTGFEPPAIPLTAPDGRKQDMSEDSTDWKVGLNWSVRDDQFLYALISRGHVTGGINLFPPFLSYDEMEVVNYEAGWKATWLEGSFRTQFNVYYETFDNYQANFALTGPDVGTLSITAFHNASGSSEIWGAEFSGQAVLGNFGLDFGMAYLDSELGTFKNVIDPFLLPPDNIVDLSGAKSPFSPEYTGNIGLSYVIHLPGGATLTPRVDVAYQDDSQAGLWNSPIITLKSRTLTNVQLRFESGPWWANAWMTNVSDEDYAGGIQNNGALFYAGPPQMYGLRVGRSFGG